MKRTDIDGSFRDPSGKVYRINTQVYRDIYPSYKTQYDFLISSGLYDHLVERHLLVPHAEHTSSSRNVYKTIKPSQIPFISYPYEWCFSQLKDAALLTLDIQTTALSHDMTLKDASAYNIQFLHSKPILIDTLSFDMYTDDSPWVAYKQFCSHFLAPLLLMKYTHYDLQKLLISFLDGVPLPLASSLLPLRSYTNISCLTHIHSHARFQTFFSNRTTASPKKHRMSTKKHLTLITHLRQTIEELTLTGKSHWSTYYHNNSYTKKAFTRKKEIVTSYLSAAKTKTALDIGSNTGEFSDLCAQMDINTIAIDSDHVSIDRHYQKTCSEKQVNVLPLVVDITNPSPAIGWNNAERISLLERGPFGLILMLAVIHHLAIGHNIPLDYIAQLVSMLGTHLIIEFIPKSDIQVKRLLKNRKDIFTQYSEISFENSFSTHFKIVKKEEILSTRRVLYLMIKK